jgi:hypothetical protein
MAAESQASEAATGAISGNRQTATAASQTTS